MGQSLNELETFANSFAPSVLVMASSGIERRSKEVSILVPFLTLRTP